MTHTSRSVKRRVKRRASKSVKRKLRPVRSRKNAGHKSSNRVMRGGARFSWKREFNVSDQLPGKNAKIRPKVFTIEISEPIFGGGKYNVELTVDLDKYTDWTNWNSVDGNKCFLISDRQNEKVKNHLNQDHVAVPYSNTQELNQWGNGYENVVVDQQCGLGRKNAQQKETVYTLIDALADFLFDKKIDSVELFKKNKKQLITKDDVMKAQQVNNETKKNALFSLRSKLLDTFYSDGKTRRPCVVKMSLVPDTDTDRVNFIVTEYTVVRNYSYENSEFVRTVEYDYKKWDTTESSVTLASMTGNPVDLIENLKKKLGEFKGDTFYQVVSVEEGTRDYIGIFTFDEAAAAAAAAAASGRQAAAAATRHNSVNMTISRISKPDTFNAAELAAYNGFYD
jgi:hypothetical protein